MASATPPELAYQLGEESLEGASKSDFHLLKQALLNERNAPEILEYKSELVERIESQLDNQEALIEDLEADVDKSAIRFIFLHEKDRLKFLLKSYLRTRMRKIERYVEHILDTDELHARLAPHEGAYAQEYFVMIGKHLKEAVLEHLPESFQSLVKESANSETKDTIPTPDFDVHVFCRVLEDCGHIPIDSQGSTVDMEKDDVYIIRYRPIANLLYQNQVELV